MAKWSHPYKQILSNHASEWKEATGEDRKSVVKAVKRDILAAHKDREISEPLPDALSKVSPMRTSPFSTIQFL
jgi:hypothetical protein